MRSLFVALFLVSAIQIFTPQTVQYTGLGYDGEIYAAMANVSLFTDAHRTAPPWCWRVLSPYLISLMPFDTFDAFRINAWCSSVAVLALLGSLLTTIGFTRREVVLGQLWYAGSFYSVKFFLHNPGYIDTHTQCIILLTMLVLERRRFLFLPPLLALGALQKESLLFLVPVTLTALLRVRPVPYSTIVASLIAPPLVAYSVKHAVATPVEYSSLKAAFIAAAGFLHPGLWAPYTLSLLKGLGLIPCIVALAPTHLLEFLRTKPHYKVMMVLGVLHIFGGVDKGRLLLPTLPLFTIGALYAARALRFHHRYPLWIAATTLIHLWIGHHLTPPHPQWEYLSMVPEHLPSRDYAPLFAMFGVQLVVWGIISLPFIRPENSSSVTSRSA
jgi:hypothetical protein